MTNDVSTHIHDPDPPAPRRWSVEETAELERLRADGLTYEQIAAAMNRTKASCKERFRWINMSESEREIKNTRNFYARNGNVDPARVRRRRVPFTAPTDVFAERHQRINAPRSLTAIFCGDPAPGFSALDRKQRGIQDAPHIDNRLAQLQRKPFLSRVEA